MEFEAMVETVNDDYSLLRKVMRDGKVMRDHLWISTRCLPEFVQPGLKIRFTASPYPYRKSNQVRSVGLKDIKILQIVVEK